jgi:hypothetical protein
MRDPGKARRTDGNRVLPDLGHDVVAGLTAATVVLPKAMAYATVAGLPVSVGLYTAFVPPLVYGLLGSSRVLSVSSTTTLAILKQACGGLATALAVPQASDLLGALTTPASTGERERSRRSRLAIPIGRSGRFAEAACLDIDRGDGVTIEDLTFDGCWLAAVRAIGSRRVTLRRSLVIGSSYGLALRHAAAGSVLLTLSWSRT